MKKSLLKKYAHLIAKVGANVQKGQEVIVRSSVESAEFCSYVVEECYKLGAKEVEVEWRYGPVSKLHAKKQSLATLSEIKDWQIERLKYRQNSLPVLIALSGDDPDAMKGVNQEKMAKARMATLKKTKSYSDAMADKYQWVIAAVPSKGWAKKIFPNMSSSAAVEKLWQAILYTSRVNDDPIKAWEEHNRNLANRSAKLNELNLKELRYSASNGTSLRVGLISDHGTFGGGGDTTLNGVYFNPNIPTEEVFTSPMAGDADGIVYATKPLSYQGELIENFWVKFENGKVVATGAEKNAELLEKLVNMDEGAKLLGECALVAYDSPINKTGILFYNTLFDENCCCHLALGRGFNNTLKNFENLSFAECKKMGINDSTIHVDFMIGTPDLQIDGVKQNGEVVAIFRDGNWAF
ncbi:MAG: aminopeptidase [Clostridia bacterium]|nr:aminopeptidase [Clostridia bacterium]